MPKFFKRKKHSEADTEDFAKQLGLGKFGMYPNKYDVSTRLIKSSNHAKRSNKSETLEN